MTTQSPERGNFLQRLRIALSRSSSEEWQPEAPRIKRSFLAIKSSSGNIYLYILNDYCNWGRAVRQADILIRRVTPERMN
jgi:hypothetical protein